MKVLPKKDYVFGIRPNHLSLSPVSDKDIELSCGSSRKPKNLKAGDIVGTNTIECAETAAIGRCLKFFFGVNSDLANDEEIKYSKGLSNNLTVIETLEKRRKDVPIKH